MSNTIHFGNSNYKQTKYFCGEPQPRGIVKRGADFSNSTTKVENVTCLNCLHELFYKYNDIESKKGLGPKQKEKFETIKYILAGTQDE